MSRRGNFLAGAKYLTEGFRLITHPRLRLFILIPALINLVFFIIFTTLFIQRFDSLLNYMMDWLPGFLEFLAWVVGILIALFILLIYGYSFSAFTNLLAAPFYGVLAERTEDLITGQTPDSESLAQLIPRTVFRELTKFWYFLWRSLLILILTFIPPIGPIIGAVWGMWCMSIQYGDYAADNNKISFSELRWRLRSKLLTAMGFGGAVMLGMMIPIVNIIVMPAAVIGGTLFWMQELRSIE
ncbi:MAG: sulfate transporter CysZ [Cellvibrionaceae bacterium]